jgi:hypothetical protein
MGLDVSFLQPFFGRKKPRVELPPKVTLPSIEKSILEPQPPLQLGGGPKKGGHLPPFCFSLLD